MFVKALASVWQALTSFQIVFLVAAAILTTLWVHRIAFCSTHPYINPLLGYH